MTDETHTAESSPVERSASDRSAVGQPTDERSDEDTATEGRTPLAGWSLSTHVALLAFVYLGGTALAMVVATTATANRLAEIGVALLVVGFLLRIVERAGGERLRHAVRRGKPISTAAVSGYLPDGFDTRDARTLAGQVALFTLVGGLLVVLRWWSDPGLLVPTSFLVGWLLVLGALASLYVSLGSAER